MTSGPARDGRRRRAGGGQGPGGRRRWIRPPALLTLLALVLLGGIGCPRPSGPPATPPPSPSGPPPAPTVDSPQEGALPDLPLPAPAPGAAGEDGTDSAGTSPSDPGPTWSGPILLRIGLASDLPSAGLSCCAPGQRLEAGGSRVEVSGPVTVEPDPGSAGVLRLQVAALRDEEQAGVLARNLEERWGWPSDAHFDAGVGLYRVRAGRFPDRAAVEQARGRLEASGTTGAWIVTEGELVRPALRVVHGGRAVTVPGRWLRLVGDEAGGRPVSWDGKRYRGDLLVFLNPRGTLNVVNEVPLEDYLRGVVPAEMGPELYPRLESLKAQAVAARTYTLRHLGGFRDEGYDLCATPRCQVYGGWSAEHPLSDQAVEETAGQVLVHDGELVDARYSATCGGHTEDVGVVFPLEADEASRTYLRGVPCIEGGAVVLEGAALEGAPFPEALTRSLLPLPSAGGSPADGVASLEARLRALAERAGLPANRSEESGCLASTSRRDVLRCVSVLFDLALGPRVLLASRDLPRYAAAPPAEWSREEVRQASLLVKSGLFSGEPAAALEGADVERMLFHLARVAGVLWVEELDFHGVDGARTAAANGSYDTQGTGTAGRRLRVRHFAEAGERFLPLPADLLTFRRRGDALLATDLALVPGDPVAVWFARDARGGEGPVAIVHEADPARTVADPAHKRARWTRYRSDGELARQVEERYPGLGFTGFQVLRRGVSGRAGAIRLEGRGGRTMDVEGLAVRWTLDVPDTRFTHRRVGSGYRFDGTGWGHGVGLCQTGSFALAGRGVGYRHILRHYYTGVSLARVRSRAPLWDEPVRAPSAP